MMQGVTYNQDYKSAVYRDMAEEEFWDIFGRILYEDNHILVFNKRVGEIVQADKSNDECLSTTLKAFIAKRDKKSGAVFLGVVHRLDRPVSGCVIFSKTSKALPRLNNAFKEGKIHKKYWAVVCAKPKIEEQILVHYLVRNERQNKSYAYSTPKNNSKEARLKYRYLGNTERYYLLEVELYTGRHHQIRCQLSHVGLVIKGDLKYGAPRSNRDGGISLHSREIQLIHPVKNSELTIIAPPPNSTFNLK